MNSKILFSSILLLTILSAQIPKAYIDMNPSWLKYESKGVSSKFKPIGFKCTAGYLLKDFSFASVAIESSAMLGVNNDKYYAYRFWKFIGK